MKSQPANAETLTVVLHEQGVQGVLRVLNDRIPHRYTAAFLLDGDLLRNVFMVDKRGEARPEQLAVVPLGDSFCQFVLRDGRLCTEDSRKEPLLDGSPSQGMVIAYHGVPVTRDEDQKLVGTLCHFDMVPQPLSDEDFELLRLAARLVSADLLKLALPA